MAFITANGLPVVGAHLAFPRVGVWHCDLQIDDLNALSGDVAIDINAGALDLTGTTLRTGQWLDAVYTRIVGGKGGLGRTASPKFYQQATARLVLSDLMATSGETLSTTIAASILSAPLDRWLVSAQPIAVALSTLTAQIGASLVWRVLSDGTVWIGEDTYPAATLQYDLLWQNTTERRFTLGAESPILLPATTLEGERVDYVETHVTGDSVRIEAWYQ